MEIDNQQQTTIAKLLLITIPTGLMLGTGLLTVFLVIHTWLPVIISAGLVITGFLVTLVLRLQFVRFKISGDQIQVFYYALRPMATRFRKMEISRSAYAGGEVHKSLGGIRKDLVLLEWIQGQKAEYPPVSLLLFSKKIRTDILESLGIN
jgi:hypothetical protein